MRLALSQSVTGTGQTGRWLPVRFEAAWAERGCLVGVAQLGGALAVVLGGPLLLEPLVEPREGPTPGEEQEALGWLLLLLVLLLLLPTGTRGGGAFVSAQVPGLEEPAAALGAAEGPLARMSSQMARQLLPAAVALAAH
ncbi:hypothetical protein MRX96_002006 [Rhipicephalus microplus]